MYTIFSVAVLMSVSYINTKGHADVCGLCHFMESCHCLWVVLPPRTMLM